MQDTDGVSVLLMGLVFSVDVLWVPNVFDLSTFRLFKEEKSPHRLLRLRI